MPIEVLSHDVCFWYTLIDSIGGKLVKIVSEERDDLWIFGAVASFDKLEFLSDMAVGVVLEHLTDIGEKLYLC